MSSSHATTSYRLSNINAIVRRANDRVSRLAASFRDSLNLTHHAKQRARKLALSVCIEAALKLDPKQISIIPLPVLATPPPSQPQYSPVIVAPASILFRETEISRAVVGREREIIRRPVLRCEIPSDIVPGEEELFESAVSVHSTASVELGTSTQAPVVLRGQNVPWRPVTSRWSISTIDTDAEVEADVDITDADLEEAEQEEENPRRSGVYEGAMDLPITVSPDGPYDELEYVHPHRHVEVNVNVGGDTRRVARAPRHLVVPLRLDESRMSWGSDMTGAFSSSGSSSSSSSSSTYSSSSGASSSSSSACTSEPETPVSADI